MVAARWPSFFYFLPYDPDEAQTLAAAQTLAQHPILYRFADGASAGPLMIYGAGLPWIFGVTPTLFLARLTAVIFGWIGVSAIYFGIRTTGVEMVARLAALVTALFYGLTEFWNYVHYNSEMLPSALCAIATACLLGMYQTQQSNGTSHRWKRKAFMGAFVLSLVPFSKLQLVPLALLIGLIIFLRGLWIVGFNWRQAILYSVQLALSVLIFPVTFFLFVYLGGAFDYFIHSYIANNLIYAASGYASHALVAKKLFTNGADLIPWLWGVVISCLVFIIFGIISRRGKLQKGLGPVGSCIFFVAMATYCVLAPNRDFMHYLLILPLPLGFALGAVLAWALEGSQVESRWRAACFLAPCILLGAMAPYMRDEIRSGMLWAGLAVHWDHQPADEITKELIKRSHSPADGLLVWGYHPELNVTTGLLQATRLSTTSAQIQQNVLTPYYRKAFLEDLNSHPPRFIVDDVCESDLMFKDHTMYGPQCFPAFKEILDFHYKLVGEYSGMKLYERVD
jgi:hypothetical protein